MNNPVTERERRVDPTVMQVQPERTGDLVPIEQDQGGALLGFADTPVGAQPVAVRRDDAEVLRKLKVLAAAAGDNWFYRYPVKDKGRLTHIEGPSIKLANDVARIYGNCTVDVRALDQGASWMFYARFIDLETGFTMTRAFQQGKDSAKLGTADLDRKQNIAFQIGQSKAIRNVIVNALQTVADYAFEEARNNLVEKIGKDLPKWRDRILARLAELNVDVRRVEATVGRAAASWLATDVAKIAAELQAIRDGMATVEDTYPPLAGQASEAEKARPTRDGVAQQAQQQGQGNGGEGKTHDVTINAGAGGAGQAEAQKAEAAQAQAETTGQGGGDAAAQQGTAGEAQGEAEAQASGETGGITEEGAGTPAAEPYDLIDEYGELTGYTTAAAWCEAATKRIKGVVAAHGPGAAASLLGENKAVIDRLIAEGHGADVDAIKGLVPPPATAAKGGKGAGARK